MAQDVFRIVGTVIAGAYRVEKVVAEGGFGVVYRAHHGGFRAPVALKCLKVPQNSDAKHQASFLEQFRAEAELMFRLSAAIPTVVRPLHIDAMTTPDGSFVPFMVLEWLDGETLDEIIRRRTLQGEGPLPIGRLVQLLSPVARALERAHHFSGPQGPVCIVHRDLKPENIFIARVAGEEVVKILDFGVAKVKSAAHQVAGRASQEAGGLASFTPAYGSPEQWAPRKLGQTGPWTDVWGLALCVVEAMVGRPVIEGDHQAIMGTVLDESRRPTPRNEGVAVDDRVERILEKALAVDPRHRYASTAEFWNELLDALGLDDHGRPRPDTSPATRVTAPLVSHPGESRRGQGNDPALALDLELNLETERQALAQRSISGTRSVPDLEIPDLEIAATVLPRKATSVAPVSSRRPVASAHADRVVNAPTGPGDFELDDGEFADFKIDLPEEDTFLKRRGLSVRPPAGAPSPETPPAERRSVPPAREGVSQVLEVEPLAAAANPGDQALSSPPASRRSAFPSPVVRREPTLVQKLAPGAGCIGASILLTLVDQAYSDATGEMLTVGPLRATWIAGPLLLVGLGLLAYRLIPRS